MYKHPLRYKKEELKEIMFKPLRIDIGPSNEDIITETLKGEIIECYLAANDPHLPVLVDFRTLRGDVKQFDLFQIKLISDL